MGVTRRRLAPVFAQRGGMRREAAPADGPGETEAVEDVRIVVCDAARENLLFPGVRRGFEALQLLQRFECAALAEQSRFRVTCCQRSSQRMNCAAVTG